ncbi:peptidase M48 family protein [Natrialba magadii ATCC 43099]|uniref:Peptidase M48 Ste24p n=1 Tax=Natrialba magadii (strain ATCC 43099 / DSM 3394 / CCM 3739 / CIP 104546 / IAM 13178 / JCM 8861 / NBRC 102185 / NCIMB 2190 / MS3) TaxID=547559 RepID=D3T0M5_NATMM|nr:M48 family metalloprotease [Natrialba magadii]ADD06504.1 peptidase M48 family protein [Natrialba magadii ATCC 43099]ELY32034.1 peptidase M48 Ste24p [Natrialba magadii ATCC 43099]
MRLRLRIAAVLGVFVAVNALFVLAVVWAYGVLLPAIVGGTFVLLSDGRLALRLAQFPVSWPTALLLVGLFLAGQLYYGYRRVLAHTGQRAGEHEARTDTTDDTDDHNVDRIVRRLSMTADIPEPTIRVVDDDTPSCYTIGRFTDATIVVTTGLIDRLDAAELESVLAHEIGHIANRDVTLMTVTTLFLEITDRVYHSSMLARRAVLNPGSLSEQDRAALTWFLPLVALTSVFVAPILWLFPRVADWATRTLSQTREFAADAAAAEITGNPLALATALIDLTDASETPATDLRTTKIRALCIVPSELVNGREASALPAVSPPAADEDRDREQRVRAWLDGTTPATGDETPAETQTQTQTQTQTHPAVDERVERLAALAAGEERTRVRVRTQVGRT